MQTRDLGALNASIDIPADYVVSSDGFSFMNEDRGCAVTTSFIWNIGFPIYSLSDVEDNQQAIVAALMEGFEVPDYTILSSGYASIGDQEAYQIYFEGTDTDGVSMEMIYATMQGNNPFGCYSLLGAFPKGDGAGREEIDQIIQSFQSNGEPETTYSMWYSENIGLKFIIDNSVALGSVWETDLSMMGDSAVELIAIYPTEAAQEAGLGGVDSSDAGGVEVGYAAQYGYTTPEEVLDAHIGTAEAVGGTVGTRYTASLGGVEWLCQDYLIDAYNFSSAAGFVDGQLVYLRAMYNDSNQEAVMALCNQVLASVRPW